MTFQTTEMFAAESAAMDGDSVPSRELLAAYDDFFNEKEITVHSLQRLAVVMDSENKLRNGTGIRFTPEFPTYVGSGPEVMSELRCAIKGLHRGVRHSSNNWEVAHGSYCLMSFIQPFTHCNGKLARAVWKYCMGDSSTKGFLHTFHSQALRYSRPRLDF